MNSAGHQRLYHFPPQPDVHRERSSQMIAAAAGQTGTSRAVVLGAGRCAEIPLAHLAERFAHLALVDLDAQPLEAALSDAGLNAALRAKVALATGDLTGVHKQLEQSWQAALESASEPAQVLDQWAAIADGVLTEANPPTVNRLAAVAGAEPCDLVVASCLLSQLHAPAVHAARLLFVARFGAADIWDRHARWSQALQQLARRIEDRFMRELPALLAPGGRAYFSESVSVAFVEVGDDGQWLTPGTFRMTRSRDLTDYVGPPLEIVAGDRWNWVAATPQPGVRGRVFDVQALTLRVRGE